MKILLLGGDGMLGTDLRATRPLDVELTSSDIADLDITDRSAVAARLDAVRPDWVINAAAYTAVDRAEIDTATADAINAIAPGHLATECSDRGIAIVHFGTDYVFPGTATAPYGESDPVAPVNAYGRGKLEGERAVLASGAHALVLRTQWLFGRAGKSFPRTMWERATSRQPTRVVDEQVGRPTYTKDLARATWLLTGRNASGVVHVTNAGAPASWYDLARAVFARAGAEGLLAPCTTADYPTPAKRPAYSVLSTERLEGLLGTSLPDWRMAIDRFLDELESSAPDVESRPTRRG
jgi:dTDP-4-dehydrorhamnose reductase